jgi:malonyl-CoA decarboxylase
MSSALDVARKVLLEAAASAGGMVKVPSRSTRRLEGAREAMRAAVTERHGDLAARKRANALMDAYGALAVDEREPFFRALAEFDASREAIDRAIERVWQAPDREQRTAAERDLRFALEPARVRVLREFARQPGGVKFVVDMRAQLRALDARRDPDLAALDTDLKDLLATWFDVGLLEMHRVTWDAPASLLEKLAGYEAVHDVRGWIDLKDRLDRDRRCFAFFHPAMPDEPLIFVEVALVDSLAGNVQELLDPSSPVKENAQASTAIFFSISNCQEGLAGISLGNALIKRVVSKLNAELPNLRTFATLSPIPGFAAWLRSLDAAEAPTPLREMLAQKRWRHDPEVVAALREPLMRLCAHYLVESKRPDGTALDPVAHFHLSNGARVERINWLADTSQRGLRASSGIMVNYLYRLDHIDANQDAYATAGKIATSNEVADLLKRHKRGLAQAPPAAG